jgi:xanthine dehydrogenase accessory factor
METIIKDIEKWDSQLPIQLATVVQTWGASPRGVGGKMAFQFADGVDGVPQLSGSVSGGCVEGAVIDAGRTLSPKLLHFGVSDETAWDVGLACGGIIEVFVGELDRKTAVFHKTLHANNQAGAILTVIQADGDLPGQTVCVTPSGIVHGSFGKAMDGLVLQLDLRQSGRVWLSDGVELFVDAIRPAPTLVMVGGVHIAVGLAQFAKVVGYRTIIIDPRRAFGNDARFPDVDQVIAAWPTAALTQIDLNEETAVALLTHDPKIDDPALAVVLNSPVFYVGALGSKKTHARRVIRLREAGMSEEAIARLHAPIGLSIGAKTPEEIALSVMAEIVKTDRDRDRDRDVN